MLQLLVRQLISAQAGCCSNNFHKITCPFLTCAPLQPIKRLLATTFPDMATLQTRTTHRAIAGSRHGFLSLPPGRDKMDLLAEVCTLACVVFGYMSYGVCAKLKEESVRVHPILNVLEHHMLKQVGN